MRFSLSLITALLLVGLTACESLINDVDPDRLPTVDGKLAVQCYLSPQDTLLLATISLSRTVLGAKGTSGVGLGPLKVVLSEGNRSIELKFDEKMYAYTADARAFPIEAGKTYHLSINGGSQPISASCTVPQPIPIASARLDSTLQQSDFWSPFPWIYEVRLTWQDPVGDDNYYRIAGEASKTQWVVLNRYRPGSTTPDTIQRNLLTRAPLFFENIEQHISDRNQDGQLITSPKGIIPNYLNYTYFDRASNTQYGGNIQITKRPVTITALLLHVDKNYYDYHRTLQQQKSIDGNPFAEPVLISTNIQGGLGCFGAYNRSTITATLK